VLFAVTEGEDKPLKYPKMFQRADWVVITKVDLLPYVPFDVERAVHLCREVNPRLRFMHVSALTGRGLDAWFDFLRHSVKPLATV
jgi:hydrogenase nickel incorporation protein HypB